MGHATRVRLVHEGVNPAIAEHVASIPVEQTRRLKTLSDVEPRGVLAVSADLDVIEVPAGTWAVFRTERPHPVALQEAWAATATTWFPSQPWRLRPGPEIVATQSFDPDAGTAVCELWLPVEPQPSAG